MVVKLSWNFESADIDVKCYHMIPTVVNPLLCANMVYMSDSALVFRAINVIVSLSQWHRSILLRLCFFAQNIVTV